MTMYKPSADIRKGGLQVRGSRHPLVLFAFLCSIILALCSCSGSGKGSGAGTGSIAFTLRFPGDQPVTKAFGGQSGSISEHCSEYGIVRVEVEVYDADKKRIATGGPWDCATGEGIIEGVRMGEGISLVAILRNTSGKAILLGTKSEITVVSGETADTGPVDLILAEENRAPAAANDAATVKKGETVSQLATGATSVLANDTDPDGLMLKVNTVPAEAPDHGTLTLNADGTFSYKNDGLSSADDSFVYEVLDVFGNKSQATVTITVTNDAPSLTAGIVTPTSGNASTPFTFSVHYADPDNDSPTVSTVIIGGTSYPMTLVRGQAAANGTYSSGSITLAAGTYTYSFSFDDGNGNSVKSPDAPITVTGGPTPVPDNQPPTLTADSVSPTSGDTTTPFIFRVHFSDPDNDSPTVARVVIGRSSYPMTLTSGQAANGTYSSAEIRLASGTYTYSFSFDDGNGHAVTLNPDASIRVNAKTIAPEARSPYGSLATDVRSAMDNDGNAIAVWLQMDETGTMQVFRSEYRDGAWSDPQNLSSHFSPDGYECESPQVAMNDSGNAIIVWSQDGKIFRSEYRDWDGDGGREWYDPAIDEYLSVNVDDYGAESPQVAMNNNGDAFIVWSQYGWLYMSQYREGLGWADPANNEDILDGRGYAASPQIAMNDNGKAIVVWMDSRDGSVNNIYKKEFTVDSRAGSREVMSPDGSSAEYPQVAMDDAGNIVITWLQADEMKTGDDGSSYNTCQVFRSDYRQKDGIWSWTKPADLSDHISPEGADCNSYDGYGSPRVAVDNLGNSIIVWSQGTGIYKSEYRDGAWTNPRDLTDIINSTGSYAMCPQVTMDDNGNAVITWFQYGDASLSVFKKDYLNGAGWTDAVDLISNINFDYDYPFGLNASMNDLGSKLVAWLQLENFGDAGCHLFKFEYSDGAWDSGANLTDSLAMAILDVEDTQIAMDRYGNAIVVWAQGVSGNYYYPRKIFMSEKRNGVWTSPQDYATDCISNGSTLIVSPPQVAMDDNGNAVIAWTEESASGGNQLFVHQRLSASGWQPTQSIPNTAKAQNPQVAMDNNGNAIIVWSDYVDGDPAYYQLCKTEYRGGSWQASKVVYSNYAASLYEPRVAMDAAGNTAVIWVEQSATGGSQLYIYRIIGGEEYAAQPLTGTGNVSEPQIALDDVGVGIILGIQGDSIYRLEFESGASADPGPGSGSSTDSALNGPCIAVSGNGNAIIAWIQNGNIYWDKRGPRPGGWLTSPNVIDMGGISVSSLHAAVSNNGEAVVVWECQDGYDQYFSKLEIRGDGSDPQVTERFNPYGTWYAHTPKAAMDDQGNTIIVWSQYTEPASRVYGNIYK